jgi:hypothetical protein
MSSSIYEDNFEIEATFVKVADEGPILTDPDPPLTVHHSKSKIIITIDVIPNHFVSTLISMAHLVLCSQAYTTKL